MADLDILPGITKEELCKEILANESTILNSSRGDANVLTLISSTIDGAPNMFFFAIQHRKYASAITMLEIFNENEYFRRFASAILLAKDSDGKNCLQTLISNYVHQSPDGVILSTKTRAEQQQGDRENVQEVLRMLKMFKDIGRLATSTNETGDIVIVWAIKNKMEDIAKGLLATLECSMQLEIIKRREKCTKDCRGNKHDEVCKIGYNLLMLALDAENVHGPLIDHILNIVSEFGEEAVKSEIAMGENKPEVFSQSENSIRLAAMRGQTNYLTRLLKEFVPRAQMCNALLEVGPSTKSAIAYLLQAEELDVIANLLNFNVAEAIKKSESIEIFRSALQDPAKLKNFLQEGMSQKAIEFFYNIRLFRKGYLIPRPSDKSRPKALIFHNTNFVNMDALEHSQTEAQTMIAALKYLGWQEDMIFCNHADCTFDELLHLLKEQIEAVKTSCSLLFLCVTSHGSAGHVCGCDGRPGKIADIIADITSRIPSYVPKILIFDMCKTENFNAPDIQAAITGNNILLLSSTMYGKPADELQYMPELAKQIWEADGKSFQHKHIAAAANVYESTGQVPHMEMTGMSIYLKKYDQMVFHCVKCSKDIREQFRDCLICDHCHHWYHLKCLELDKRHKDLCSDSTFLWFCKTCYNKWHEI